MYERGERGCRRRQEKPHVVLGTGAQHVKIGEKSWCRAHVKCPHPVSVLFYY